MDSMPQYLLALSALFRKMLDLLPPLFTLPAVLVHMRILPVQLYGGDSPLNTLRSIAYFVPSCCLGDN